MARRARAGRARQRLRGLAVDYTPLRTSRDFRLLWWGELVSESGRQMTVVAIYVQVFALTGSSAAVGLVGLAQVVPLVVMSVVGQSIVDAVDRRKLLMVTQVGYALTSTVLLLGAALGPPPVGLVYVMAGVAAGLSAIDNPTRSAMIPRLVGREQLPAAIAVNQVMWNTTIIVGPAVGGVVIARLGLEWAYGIDVVTYVATIGAAALMRPMPPEHGEAGPARGIAAVREGLAYVRGRRVLQSTFAIDLVAMIFGLPRALFPALAVSQFHGGTEVVGGMFSAIAVGALAGALTSGWVGGVDRQGRAVVAAVVVWGAGIAAFGLVGDRLWLAYFFLAVAGAADVVSAVFRSTILQLSVPEALRGRMSSIHILVVTGGPKLGDVEAGLMAAAFSPTVSVVSGGLACIAGAVLLAVLVPEFDRYRVRSEGRGAVGEGIVAEHGVGPGEGAAHALVDPPRPGEGP